MRSDYSNQNNRSKDRKSKWDKPRVLRALIFVLIGLTIGFWLHNKNKSNPPTSGSQVQAAKPPAQIVEDLELPSIEHT